MGKQGGAGRPVVNPPSKEDSRETVETNLPNEIINVIGQQYKEHTISGDLEKVNKENYMNENLKNSLYHENCQRCAPTFELRRRGFDVEALPFEGQYLDFRNIFQVNNEDFDSYVQGQTASGWMFGGSSANPNKMGRGPKGATDSIINAMTKWGDGSRATLEIAWKGTSSAHIINVENVGGEIYFFDSQSGGKIKGRSQIEWYMSRTTAINSQLTRVDHLPLRTDERAVKALQKITKRKDRK